MEKKTTAKLDETKAAVKAAEAKVALSSHSNTLSPDKESSIRRTNISCDSWRKVSICR